MTNELIGLRVVRTLITCPAQWRILLSLTTSPQSGWALWRQLPLKDRRCGARACWHLWRQHLIVFHVEQWVWGLSPTGESLRPILQQILTCQREESK
jgi:hypothetical protein